MHNVEAELQSSTGYHHLHEWEWGILKTYDWAAILAHHPEYLKCRQEYMNPPFDKFKGSDWVYLLAAQPQLSDLYKWELTLDGWEWVELFQHQPRFIDRPYHLRVSYVHMSAITNTCKWMKLDCKDLARLLAFYPGLASVTDLDIK